MLKVGVTYVIPPIKKSPSENTGTKQQSPKAKSTKIGTTINEPLFGKQLANVKVTSNRLAGACFYPVLTVQLLDKQPRLTVSSIEDKRQALLAGLGVATMPYPLVERDIAEGRLRVVSPEYSNEIDIIMAWRRDSMGEAKSWCLREIPKLFMTR